MVHGFNPDYTRAQLGWVAFNVLYELVLGAGGTRDQHFAGATNCLDHRAKEVLIFRAMPAADGIGLVMNMPCGVLGMDLLKLNLVRVEMEHARLVVIYPNDCMKNLGHSALPIFK